jgi:hypothetical protein
MRRVWTGVYVGAFVLFTGIALKHNLVQGLALALLGLVIGVMAFVYDRLLRRS